MMLSPVQTAGQVQSAKANEMLGYVKHELENRLDIREAKVIGASKKYYILMMNEPISVYTG